MSKNFIKNKEDFTCLNCGAEVIGNGYTNHCPKCLWSQHVDNLPGDRANSCCGLMEPIGIEKEGQDHDLVHRCQKCGLIKKNKTIRDDDIGSYLTGMLK
ncbi:MAG: hypothetical protein UV64_C0004G0005 [Parcubacteria group bacterium GW2011_GWC1_43_11b]|uniref:RNHCP domain-containing protein n=2 Tax=Candidatus Vogeliibacteriota TaxID=1817922 RepID=A0A1G2QCL8_9BACT|nr:MAG: hypothetical protein UV50_C0009G0012 [Parcubacteria group bacterium GW2011_GWB1_42_9]KKS89537.1 MAG: hypothetical protein UV64_C0004G0005 [Parcubacteria group bacterium GW2011_GWC1_43_11b]KKT09855.1 MAG: hypothetical protein UV88_C0004G0006 [Parcubacteria group bacterium GW2011_GWA1_43_21]OHA58153.1 MAG: hypothetical protein A2370_00395 [Candidatus Vogelbacteria bacterium RIFOXYB1_FULL_42_16]OHA59314.1 MAG: hypothetical protein A2607_00580 [Candidatus Vogelbacteria bacterium RIFOXYD1_FU